MGKRLLAALLLFIFTFTMLPLDAEAASHFRGEEIKNVSINVKGDKVTLKWDVNVVDRLEFNWGGKEITVRRSTGRVGQANMDVVKKLPVPSSEGVHTMTWTDNSPPAGTVYYNIESGSIAKRNKNVEIYVPESMQVKATGYSWDCGTGDDKTANGTWVRWGVVAVDPTVIPYGTEIYIPELDATFVAEDCGGAVKGKHIDIFFNTEEEALEWGNKNITIYLTGKRELGEHNAVSGPRAAYEGSVDWSEKMASSLLLAIPNYLVQAIGLYDPIELVFMRDAGNKFRTENMASPANVKYLYTYTDGEMGWIANFYDTVAEFAPIWMVVMIVLIGLGLLWISANPQSKIGFREYLIGVIAGIAILKFGPSLISLVFDVNYAIVKQFEYVVGHVLKDSFLDSLYNEDAGKGLGNAIIAFVAVFGIGVINFQYIMRKIMIAMLIGLIPIVAVIAISPARREVLGIWCKEFIANVFLQSAHAAALAFLLVFVHASDGSPQEFWVQLAAVFGLATMAGLVRRVTGAETFGGAAAGVGAMFGLAALAGVGRMLSGGGRGGGIGKAVGTAAGSGGGGAILSRVAGGAARLGLGLGGAMVGGLAAGAATGNPAMGMMLGGSVGASAGGRAGDEIAGLTSSNAYQGHNPLDQAASDASTEVFGRNVMAERTGLRRLADGVTGKHSMIHDARAHMDAAQQAQQSTRLDLTQARAQRDMAKAQFGEVKGQQAKYSALQDSVSKLTAERKQVEQGMLQIAQNNSGSMDSWSQADQQAFSDYQQTYDDIGTRIDVAQQEMSRIEVSDEQYNQAFNNMRQAEMGYAERHVAYANAEQALSRESLAKEFGRIKQSHTPAPGGVDGPKWRV